MARIAAQRAARRAEAVRVRASGQRHPSESTEVTE
jgi:hypothetical protein